MTTGIFTKLFFVFASAMFFVNSCNTVPHSIPYLNNGKEWDKSIVVLGDWDGNPETPYTYLHWAPVNAGFDETGEIGSRDDHRCGRLYQWGAEFKETNVLAKMRYYNEPQPKFWYTGISVEMKYTGESWNNDQGPCPKGWRLPSSKEFQCLIMGRIGSYGWTTEGTYAGINSYSGAEFFGLNDDITPGKGVFLPAAGQLDKNYGGANMFGEFGGYWTAESETIDKGIIGDYARAQSPSLVFGEEEYGIKSSRHSFGFSVRCVHDVEDND